jgi:hypothetical protein
MDEDKMREIIEKHFGPRANIEPGLWTERWRITNRYGEVDFYWAKREFGYPIGGPQLVEQMLLALHELHPGFNVALNGDPQFMAMCVAHAERLGIPYEPQIYDTSEPGCLSVALGFVPALLFWIFGPGGTPGEVGGLLLWIGSYFLLKPVLLKQAKREGRRKGMVYRNMAPPAYRSAEFLSDDEIGGQHLG